LQTASQEQSKYYQENIDELNIRIEELEAQLLKLQEQLPRTITCVKGKVVRKVTGVKPRCPSGFVLKG
jgi:hypothetical protein